ncbi:hypothetical protein [Gemmobacter denitrificans]|uniref:Porin n=1 Tax=Gemmobacter denitrificans TaxID=3123040 RepID=A0ABU8BTX0_9RHOB
MFITRVAGIVGLMALLPTAAHAEFVGGSLSLSHSAFVDDTDEAKSAARGSFDFQWGQFGLQSDLGIAGLHALDRTNKNITTHGYYSFAPGQAAGLFYSVDIQGSSGEGVLGAEYTQGIGATQVEAYLGRSTADTSATLAGFNVAMPVGAGGLEMGLDVDFASVDGGSSATKYGVTGVWALGDSTRFIGEVGAVAGRYGTTNPDGAYVKLGVDFRFGANGGATFGERSILNAFPGR